MKYCVYTFLTIFSLFVFGQKVKADDVSYPWVEVSTAADLVKQINDGGCNIRLTADIDMNGVEYSPTKFTKSISGKKSDGTCCTIRNLSKELFLALESATVENLVFSGCTYESDNKSEDMGILAAIAISSTVENVTLSDCVVKDTKVSYVGGLTGNALSCSFKNIKAKNVDVKAKLSGACIVGLATSCTLENCETDALSSVWCDNLNTGGICGFMSGGSISKCTNGALVMCNGDKVGGIAGNIEKFAKVSESLNTGFVFHCSSDQCDKVSKLFTSETVDNIVYDRSWCRTSHPGTFSAPDEAGGIVGHIQEQSDVTQCCNKGVVESSDAYAGGIVGYMYGSKNIAYNIKYDNECTVTDCINLGAVLAGEQAGGIVGTNKEGTIRRCVNAGMIKAKKTTGYIQGDTSGTVICVNNYQSSGNDADDPTLELFTTKTSASGLLATYLNIQDGSTPLWHQTIGTDLYPVPFGDGHVVTESDIKSDVEIPYTEVSTPRALQQALYCSISYTKLTQDISLSGSPLVCSSSLTWFHGAVDGHGYAIKDVTNSSDDENTGKGIFEYASKAAFKNLTLYNIHNTCSDDSEQNGLLCGYSEYSTFDNITVGGGSQLSARANSNGCLAGYSKGDTFTGCIIDPTVSVTIGDDDSKYSGALAGYCEGSTATSCMNGGNVTCARGAGGFFGETSNGKFYYCLNYGTVKTTKTSDSKNHEIGGFVGHTINELTIEGCLALGNVSKYNNDNGCFYGISDGNKVPTNSAYYVTVNGTLKSGNYDLGTTPSDDNLTSGAFTYLINQKLGTTHWYQSLDNDGYITDYPCPVAAAGTVMSNILCPGTQSYSNRYNSTSRHDPPVESAEAKICTTCGRLCNVSEVSTLAELETALATEGNTIYIAQQIDVPSGTTATLDLNSCTLKPSRTIGYIFSDKGTLTIKGSGTISNSNMYGGIVNVAEGGDFTLSGGTLSTSSRSQVVVSRSGSTCKITGGTIENSGQGGALGTFDKICISGGTVKGSIAAYSSDATYEITGGKFSVSPVVWMTGDYGVFTTDVDYWGVGLIYGILYPGSNQGVIAQTLANLATARQTNPNAVLTVMGDMYKFNTAGRTNIVIWNTDAANKTTYTCPNLELTDGYSFYTPADFTAENVSYSRTMQNQWGTICLPFAIETGSDYDLYELTGVSDNNLNLSKVSSIGAGTPAIIRRNEEATGISLTLQNVAVTNSITNPDAVDGLTVTGAFATTEITDADGYIIANNAFWNIADVKGENKVFCSPFRAYLVGSVSGARCLTIDMGETNLTPTLSQGEGELNGKFIVNGRLVIIRNGKVFNANGQTTLGCPMR